MSSFATPQRPARKPSHPTAAPVAVEKASQTATTLPDAAPLVAERPARCPIPIVPIPLFRPDLPASSSPTPHTKQSPAPAMRVPASEEASSAEAREARGAAREASPEAVTSVAQARISVKSSASGAAGTAPNTGGVLPIQRKTTTGLPDALKTGNAALSAIMLDDVRVRDNSPKQAKAMPGGAVIQRAYVGADATTDVALFPKEQVADEAIDLSASAASAKAATLGITGVNLKHYLNRHTFRYQPLTSASTYPPQTGMFPIGTDKDAVKSMVVEAIGKVPDGKTISADIESISVDLANGLKVNLGALAGNKLQAFFPQSGTGFHEYSNVELQAIKVEKDALEAPAKALVAKAQKDKKDKQDAEKAEKAAKNKAFLAAKAAKATATTTVVT